MTQEKLKALLGRPLTPTEVANLASYLEIATEAAQSLLCMNLAATPGTRAFLIREGYSTVFTDLFKTVSSVKVDGETISSSKYYAAFWDNRNLSYNNSLVFDSLSGKEVEITADFGFNPLPFDLQQLLARAYAQSVAPTAKKNVDVKRKDVRNFSVTFGDLTTDDVFMRDNAAVINKYSLCNIGYIRHGDICNTHRSRSCGCI